MKRSDNMIAYTERKKKETINKVQDAIDILKAEGREVKRSDILEITGLSTAVLSKPHVKDILKTNKVLMYGKKKIMPEELPDKYVILEKENANLKKTIKIYENKIQNNEIAINYLKGKELKAKAEFDTLNNDYQRLLGKFQKLLEKVERIGIDLSELGLY